VEASSYLLAFTCFPYPHTALRNQDIILDKIHSFGLETKVISCVTDNEEATVQRLKAVKLIRKRLQKLDLSALEVFGVYDATSVKENVSRMPEAVDVGSR
jgi:hypothetical protein